MSDQIAILSFYLAMVTLLTMVFFVRLDEWFGDILSLEKIVKRFEEDKKNNGLKLSSETKSDLSTKRLGLEAASPWRGYAVVAFFVVILSVLAFFLGRTVDETKMSVAGWFLFFPGGLFVVLFLVGAAWFIHNGSKRLLKLTAAVKKL